MDFCSEKAHLVYIECLSLRILHAHVDLALHAKERRRRRCRYAVLACACLGDDTGLSHLLREKHLTEHVVDLMGAGMVQILSL